MKALILILGIFFIIFGCVISLGVLVGLIENTSENSVGIDIVGLVLLGITPIIGGIYLCRKATSQLDVSKPNAHKDKSIRPKIITIVCCVLFIMGIIQAVMISFAIDVLAVRAYVWGLASNLIFLVSVYGLWQMRRWGAYLLFILMVINIAIVLGIRPDWSTVPNGKEWAIFILPAIFFLTVIPYWKKLLRNNDYNKE